MILAVATLAVLMAMTLGVVRALLLALIGFLTGRPEFLDIGILYALLNIIGTLAVLKFFRYGDLSHPGGEEPGKS
jgi:multicomponent Na+:H+ antiporter subunit F